MTYSEALRFKQKFMTIINQPIAISCRRLSFKIITEGRSGGKYRLHGVHFATTRLSTREAENCVFQRRLRFYAEYNEGDQKHLDAVAEMKSLVTDDCEERQRRCRPGEEISA